MKKIVLRPSSSSREELKTRNKVKECQKRIVEQLDNQIKLDPFHFEEINYVGDMKQLIDPLLNPNLNSNTISKGDGTKLHWRWYIDNEGLKNANLSHTCQSRTT